MKKQAAILLSIFYLLSSTGFAVNVDFCCNNIKSVTISQSPVDGPSCTNKKMMEKGCCSHHHQYVKVKGKYAAPPTLQVNTPHFLTAIIPYIISHKTPLQASYISTNTYSQPPPLPDIPVFLRNCVFLI